MAVNAPVFTYDVFLSHSAKDKAVVRPLAERLRADGVKVSFDEWVLKPAVPLAHRMGEGSGVRAAKIEEGPFKFGTRNSEFGIARLCMSAHTFDSDWAQLESGTFRFRDPLNKERRFLPLRLDDAPIKGSNRFRKEDVCWQFANRTQSRTLATLRDTLLLKLPSEEIGVGEITSSN